MDDITYWKDLASMACRRLIEQNNEIAAAVIRDGTMDVRFDSHDSWNGGIDYWTLVFILKYNDYIAVESQKSQIEKDLASIFSSFHSDETDRIANVVLMLDSCIEPAASAHRGGLYRFAPLKMKNGQIQS